MGHFGTQQEEKEDKYEKTGGSGTGLASISFSRTCLTLVNLLLLRGWIFATFLGVMGVMEAHVLVLIFGTPCSSSVRRGTPPVGISSVP